MYRPEQRKILLAGYGPGDRKLITGELEQALREADLIIGSGRVVCDLMSGQDPAGSSFTEGSPGTRADVRIIIEVSAQKICSILETQQYETALCLFSGDSSFYSGADKLEKMLRSSKILFSGESGPQSVPAGPQISRIAGISSLSLMCARLGISRQEITVRSAHGRDCDIVRAVMKGRPCFILTGGKDGVRKLCGDLVRAGLGDLRVRIGERLSYPDERIRTMSAQEACGHSFDSLSVMVADPAPAPQVRGRNLPGIEDELFIRGRSPMTKRVVRTAILSELDPSEDDVCWDLGAGTGSVSIELSRFSKKVISVERDEEAAGLLSENRRRFGAYNMYVITGRIEDVLDHLETPDKVFVGGGGRNIGSILDHLEKPARICASAVTLETLQTVREELQERGFDPRITQIAVTDVRRRGSFHMMEANNPVFLITADIS